MDNLLGLLRIRVKKGTNLAIRDFRSSDPYCIVKMGEQRLRTHIVYRDLNPVWDEYLTLSIENPELPIELVVLVPTAKHSLQAVVMSQMVLDHDTFTRDDEMGDAEFEIKTFLEAHKMNLDPHTVPNGTILKRIEPSEDNCLSEESCVIWKDGMIMQKLNLTLRNVESGEIELELHWIDLPGVHNI